MRKMLQCLWLTMICILLNEFLFAQDSTGVNGLMRSNNKIYVVMAVCITILIGLILYLVRIDRKVNRKERQS